MAISPPRTPSPQRFPSPASSYSSTESAISSAWSAEIASLKSTVYGSEEMPFTVYQSWTLEHINRDLAKINFNMVLKRPVSEATEIEGAAAEVKALTLDVEAQGDEVQNSLPLGAEARDVALTEFQKAQALVKEERSGEHEINVEFEINGNTGCGKAHLIGKDHNAILQRRKITFDLQITSSNPSENNSPEAMQQQEQILTTINDPDGLIAYETSPIALGAGYGNLCLERRVIDENDYLDVEATTHLVFHPGISNPMEKSTQERYETMLTQNIYAESGDCAVKATLSAMIGLVKLYMDGQLQYTPLCLDELLGLWSVTAVDNEYNGDYDFNWAKLEDGSYSVAREYVGYKEPEEEGDEISHASCSAEGIAINTTTQLTIPPRDPKFHNVLFWDGPVEGSPYTAQEQRQRFLDNPPVVVSRASNYALLLTSEGTKILLEKGDEMPFVPFEASDSEDDINSDSGNEGRSVSPF